MCPSLSFSWIMESAERGKKQTAYQILLADNKKDINRNSGNYWDSGKIISEKNHSVIYKGEALQSNQTYYWKVRIWDEQDVPTEYSKTTFFTTSNSRFRRMERQMDWPWNSTSP